MLKYLISIASVALLSVLAGSLIKSGALRSVVTFVCGLLVLLVVISPLMSIDPAALSVGLEQIMSMDETKETAFRDRFSAQVKRTTEEYIATRGRELGCDLRGEVTLDEGEYPIPYSVVMTGKGTPHQIQSMTEYLTNALGIPPERQEWKLYGT